MSVQSTTAEQGGANFDKPRYLLCSTTNRWGPILFKWVTRQLFCIPNAFLLQCTKRYLEREYLETADYQKVGIRRDELAEGLRWLAVVRTEAHYHPGSAAKAGKRMATIPTTSGSVRHCTLFQMNLNMNNRADYQVCRKRL